MNQDKSSHEKRGGRIVTHPLLRKYLPRVQEDLAETYSRDLHRWLIIAPIIGITTGLVVAGIAEVILRRMWPVMLGYYLNHHWAIVPGITLGAVLAGLIMQYFTKDPNEHSTEEVIRSYHEHEGEIDTRMYVPKTIAAVGTVGFGGSSALEGPAIYSGAAMGSWLWWRMRRFGNLQPRDRRIMLICGAAAGMSAIFRAPLTGIVFALEMPYKDDLAHEALVPSLIASVVSYMTLGSILKAQPLFDFASTVTFTRTDLYWCALLGLIVGLVSLAFTVTFRRLRGFVVRNTLPHWVKMGIGGVLTGLCGLIFLHFYPGNLVPIGANYEAIPQILNLPHTTMELVNFALLKMGATMATLGTGGVSAMFVPLFLTGGSIGAAFAQAVVHTQALELYAAVGMASFISAAYKTPLAAVVFVAEATGGHAFIVPALIAAAVAYAVSGDASASGDQRVHEERKA